MNQTIIVLFISFLWAPIFAHVQSTPNVKYGVALFDEGEYLAASQQLRPLSDSGDATASYYMRRMYKNGFGVQRDINVAIKYFTTSAKQGNASAEYSLGNIYANGI